MKLNIRPVNQQNTNHQTQKAATWNKLRQIITHV